MPKYTTDEDLDLLNELGVETVDDPVSQRLPREERIIAGFEEIQRFVESQGRLPQQVEDRDIFERLYAVRLDRLRESEECRAILESLDSHGLLDAGNDVELATANISDAELLAALQGETDLNNDITQLTHVRSRQEIKSAEEIAQHMPCKDFEVFKPIFKQVQQDLETGVRQAIKYQDDARIQLGDLFILKGQKAIVATVGETFIGDSGLENFRLRFVYDNGTESDLLMRSLQRALNKDKASRRITKPETDFGPLFSHVEAEEDLPTGYIYVLRSQSDDPFIAKNRSVIHKIGVTGGDVKKRIVNAKKDPTYLLAGVEIVTTFKLANINRKKLETILHKFFDPARLEVQLQDRFGIPVNPREWFLVPLGVIEEVIEKIQEGTIDQFRYDPESASLTRL